MAGRRLTYEQAGGLIAHADALTDVRISLGWSLANGQRLPVLRISTKSAIDHRAKAKPLGTVYRNGVQQHYQMLFSLSLAIENALYPEPERADS